MVLVVVAKGVIVEGGVASSVELPDVAEVVLEVVGVASSSVGQSYS